MKGLYTATAVSDGLANIHLPDLPRPAVADTDPNDELVYWGVNVYTYAMLANVRELLRGVLLLNTERDVVGLYGLAGQLLESTAHCCYVSRNLANYVKRSEWKRAWNWLSKSIIGNLYMRQNATAIQQEFAVPVPKMPEPPSLATFMNAYEQYQLQAHGEADAQNTYEFLSEFYAPKWGRTANALRMEK